MNPTIPVIAALALALAGCGDDSPAREVCGDLVCSGSETAASCAADCGCGNAVVNPGEDCDGADLGGATCESVAQRGGTLACTPACTFDTTGCTDSLCGNGVIDPGEECEGDDVAGATCESVGFSGGHVACGVDCQLDLAACCNNFCDEVDTAVCAGDTVESCVMQANGCLGLEVTDCAATDDVCDDTSGVATCACIDRCSFVGQGRCNGSVAETCMMEADGCLGFVAGADCGMSGQACAVGPTGATCVAAATGEDCSDPYPLHPGANVIAYTATTADHLTSQPTCNSSTLTGPDVVLSYTATVDGILSYAMDKSTSQRHVIVVTGAACGTITTLNEVSCIADSSPAVVTDTFAVTAGTTYFFYIRDTTTGTSPLPSPLALDLEEAACSTLTNAASNLAPANGAVLATTNPVLSLDFEHPVNPTTGVITITGDLGTTRTFDLSTAPPQVSFSNGERTMEIDPSTAFKPSERITVSWSGLVDQFCAAPIAPPTWTFSILTPSCTPGVNGMVGQTMTRHATGLPSFSEQFVAADTDPNGYIYLGGLSNLYRVPKAGGPFEDIELEADLATTQLGYTMAIVGGKLFTVDTTISATNPFLYRLSINGGLTWNPLAYGRHPVVPGDEHRAVFHDDGRLYFVTDEITSSTATEIWSVSTSAIALPQPAVLEASIAGLNDCDGLTGDDQYFYLTCDDSNDHIIRIDRTTLQPELITDVIPLSLTKNELHAHDLDGDGRADVLYVKTDDETVRYICDPGGAGPFWHDILVDFGGTGTTSNYGLGFDPTANVLWAYDDDTQELISIQ